MVRVEQTAFMFPVRTFQAGTVGSRYVVIRRGWKVSLINITNTRFWWRKENGNRIFKHVNLNNIFY